MTLAVPGDTGFVALAQRAVIGYVRSYPGRRYGKINWVFVRRQEQSDPERHPTHPQGTGTDNTHQVFVTHRGSKPLSVARWACSGGRTPNSCHRAEASPAPEWDKLSADDWRWRVGALGGQVLDVLGGEAIAPPESVMWDLAIVTLGSEPLDSHASQLGDLLDCPIPILHSAGIGGPSSDHLDGHRSTSGL